MCAWTHNLDLYWLEVIGKRIAGHEERGLEFESRVKERPQGAELGNKPTMKFGLRESFV